MLLTRECDYGIRIIRALADGGKKTMEEICSTEHIPGQYAYKILKKLQQAEFLRITLGRGGGYQLIKPLQDFTMYDVIIAVDDNLFIFECLRDDAVCPFKTLEQPCTIHNEFERIHNRLIDELRLKTMNEVL